MQRIAFFPLVDHQRRTRVGEKFCVWIASFEISNSGAPSAADATLTSEQYGSPMLGISVASVGSFQAAGQTSAPLVGGLAAEVDFRLAFAGVGVVALLLGLAGLPPTPVSAR